jgi:alanyl aminopeptidase
MRALGLVAVGLTLASVSCRPAPSPQAPAVAVAPAQPAEVSPVLRLPTDLKPTRYRLALEVDPAGAQFAGTVEIDLSLARSRSVIWLHGLGLTVSKVEVLAGGKAIAGTYRQLNDDGLAQVTLAEPLPAGAATLRATWSAAYQSTSQGLFRFKSGGEPYLATQLEPVAARRVFPCFDEPAFKTPFELTVTAPEADLVVSNTFPAETHAAGPGRTRTRFEATRPLPTYLVVLAVGPYAVVDAAVPPSAVRAQPLPMRLIVAPHLKDRVGWAVDSARAVVLALEDYFGTPFPFPKLDHVGIGIFPGAMENAGAITYNEAGLALDPHASVGSRQAVTSVIAHETAHQWFGDLVTPAWWTDIWLNESFATWMASRLLRASHPEWKPETGDLQSRDGAMRTDVLPSTRSIRQELTAMSEVSAQFDEITYQKGGAVLGMFERWMGPERFRDGVRAYIARHDEGTGSTDDFFAALSKVAGRELAPAFASFTERSGVPTVKVTPTCVKGAGAVELEQERWRPRGTPAVAGDPPWSVPVCVRYATDKDVREQCTLSTEAHARLELPGGCPRWVHPNSAGAGYYRWTLPHQDLEALLTRGLTRLSSVEKLDVLVAATAGRASGAIPAADSLRVMRRLATDDDVLVAGTSTRELREVYYRLLPVAELDAVEAQLRPLYRAILAHVGWTSRPGEAPWLDNVRARVVGGLMVVRDPATMKELARLGEAYLGKDGALHPDQVEPSLASDAVTAYVVREGEKAIELVMSRLEKASPEERGVLLDGLGYAMEKSLAPKLTALWNDPRLIGYEGIGLVGSASFAPRSRDVALDQLERSLDDMLGRYDELARSFMPTLLEALCEPEQASRFEAVLAPRVERFPVMRQAYLKTQEGIRACLTERAADHDAALASLR